MKFEDSKDLYKEIAPNGYRIRGYFINEVIVIARLMDRHIVKHFTDDADKQMELIELFISTKRVSFEGKRQAFKAIVDKYYPTRFKDKDKIYANLKKIEDLRNILAHNILDTRQEAVESIKNGVIGFLSFHNESILITYNKDEIENFKTIIKDLQKELFDGMV